jgi:hypothetical protein
MKHATLALIYLIICSCSGKNKLNSIRQTFGLDQNNARKFRLVAVEPNFKLTEDISIEGRRFIFVNDEESKLTVPGYLRKIILLDSTKQYISLEEDYFKNPVEKKYLIVQHVYSTSLTTISLQYIAEDPGGGSSVFINMAQADSVLRSWNISRNPFLGQVVPL